MRWSRGPAFHPYLSGRDNLLRLDAADRTARRRSPGSGSATRWSGSGWPRPPRKRYRAYSLGMRQRLGLAAALLAPRDLLVLDEPTNGLDPQGTREVRAIVATSARRGATVLLSSHLLSEVEQVCSHVGVMSHGRLVFSGSLHALRAASGTRVRVDTTRPAAAAAVLHQLGTPEPDILVGGVVAELGSVASEDITEALVRAGVPVRQLVSSNPTSRSCSSSSPGRVSMSTSELALDVTGQQGAVAVPARRVSSRLLRSELAPGVQAAPQPCDAGRAGCRPDSAGHRHPRAAPARGEGPPFLGQVTQNGLFLGLASVLVALPLFLPLAVSVVAGDSVAGEASTGTLRYLLAVPAGRTRLLAVKYASVAAFALACAVTVVGVGILAGVVLFPAGDVTLLSGTSVGMAEALYRALLATVYIAAMLSTVGAIGLFFSTLTEVPMGAMAATATLTVISQILDTIPQVSVIHEYLYTHWWLAFGDLLRDPIAVDGVRTGLVTQAVYVVVFGTLAWARFTTKDVTS